MGQDVKVFNACTHIVDGVQYDPQLCPRCYNKGYYFDMHLDQTGQPVLTNGTIKLQQEVLKVILDQKFTNFFHPQWGSQLHDLIGKKNNKLMKAKLEIAVRKALEHLKAVQINEKIELQNLDDSEILDQILYIDIKNAGPTGYLITVIFSNVAKEITSQTVLL